MNTEALVGDPNPGDRVASMPWYKGLVDHLRTDCDPTATHLVIEDVIPQVAGAVTMLNVAARQVVPGQDRSFTFPNGQTVTRKASETRSFELHGVWDGKRYWTMEEWTDRKP